MSQRSLSRSQSEIVRTEQTDFAGQYDYVFVFNMVERHNNSGVFEQSDYAKHCILSMLEAGLEVFPYLSIQQDELIVLVKASDEILMTFADKTNYSVLLDPIFLENTLRVGNPSHHICPVEILDDRSITPYSPYEYIYLSYSTNADIDPRLYAIPPGEKTPFFKNSRLKVILNLLKACTRDGGCNLEIDKLLHKKKMLGSS